jgi:membrane protease YdiL (CAAX protease family)
MNASPDRNAIRQLYARATTGPAYPPDAGDQLDLRVFGVDLPLRAAVALTLATALVLLDYQQLLLPENVRQLGDSPAGLRGIALERLVVFGLVPLGIVVLGFRDDPGRYGLRLGDWRWGLSLLVAGLAVMTPIILALSTRPEFRDYYRPATAPLGDVLVTNLVELIPAEFLLRGFLMFALLRRMGPLAILVVQVPFIFSHLGKPEVELWSTFVGGTVFAWLDWRTGSVLWSALGHVYVLTLMIMAVGAAATG